MQYRERLLEIHLLKLKVTDISRELQIRTHEVRNVEALKQEIQRVQRELLQERTKVKALSEELENPMNVHRWRKLEGSDPRRYELIQKIQTLQKRLIQKTEDVVEKELMLQEKERLYIELKNILARQPGPEVAEQLTLYQQSLKGRHILRASRNPGSTLSFSCPTVAVDRENSPDESDGCRAQHVASSSE